MPQLTVTMCPTADLVPYAGNAKIHTDAQVEQIANSIRDFGFNDPVGVWHDEGGEPVIVEGHGRVLAAQLLGMEELPTISLDHLTDAQRRAYVHVHNQTTLSSGFDLEALQAELEALPEFDWSAYGFDAEEALESLDGVEEDALPDEQPEPRCKEGDLWQLGRHRLLCGDSTDPEQVARLMGGAAGGPAADGPALQRGLPPERLQELGPGAGQAAHRPQGHHERRLRRRGELPALPRGLAGERQRRHAPGRRVVRLVRGHARTCRVRRPQRGRNAAQAGAELGQEPLHARPLRLPVAARGGALRLEGRRHALLRKHPRRDDGHRRRAEHQEAEQGRDAPDARGAPVPGAPVDGPALRQAAGERRAPDHEAGEALRAPHPQQQPARRRGAGPVRRLGHHGRRLRADGPRRLPDGAGPRLLRRDHRALGAPDGAGGTARGVGRQP